MQETTKLQDNILLHQLFLKFYKLNFSKITMTAFLEMETAGHLNP